jgi:serine/threonine-protein kinase
MMSALKVGDRLDLDVPCELTVLEEVYRSVETERALYKVHREADGLTYALKVFPLVAMTGGDLRREMAALNRQNDRPDRLPRFRGLHESNRCAYMLLDWINGVTLDRVINRQRTRSREDVVLRLAFARELCLTVAQLHRAHFLHRDLKPENVIARSPRRPSDGVAVVDFGLAGQPRAALEGTLGFRAPEQEGFRSFNLGPPTDVFAIGQVVWFLLTGSTLMLVPNDGAVGWAGDSSPSLASLVPDVKLPPELEPELRRAMAFRPEQRHRNAEVLGQSLRSLMGPSAI